MNLASRYDWIVLGDHPGALLSANLASKLGLSVLVIPHCSTRPITYSVDGQCLDPESNYILGAGPKGLLSLCLNQFEKSFELFHKQTVLPQALTPYARVEFKDQLSMMESELSRELGTQHASERRVVQCAFQMSSEVLEHWLSFPSQLTFTPLENSEKNLKDASEEKIKKKKKSEEAGNRKKIRQGNHFFWQSIQKKCGQFKGFRLSSTSEVVDAFRFAFFSQSFSSSQKSEEGLLEAVHAIALGSTGNSFRGGMSAYRKFLLTSAKKKGVTVLDDAECKRIFVENGRFVGVQVSTSANMVAGSACMLGSAFSEFSERISMNGQNWLSRKRTWPSPTGWQFTIALSVDHEAIAPGISPRMIWKEADAPVVEIEISDAEEYGTKDTSRKLIFLRTILPFTTESLNVEFQRMTSARMFKLAAELMPYLEYHVMKIYPDFRMESREQIQRAYPFTRLQEIPENLRSYGRPSKKGYFFQGSGAASGIEGLFVSSGQSAPDLGSLGPTVAALEGVAWVAHRLGLPGPITL